MVLQLSLSGLAMGAIYALVALGFTLLWNAVSVVNFAQGEVVMFPAFISVAWLGLGLKLPWFVNLLVTMAIMAVFGVLMARGMYMPLRNAPPLAMIVSTIGLSIFLKNISVVIWGPEPIFYPGPVENVKVRIFGSLVTGQNLLILGILLVLMVLQQFMLTRTELGKAMRAVAQDREVARLMGIPTTRIISLIFAYACVLGGVAGVLLAPVFYVSADMGGMVSLKAFSATIIGGFGNVGGAVIGGLLLGLVEALGGAFLSSEYLDVISFGLLIAFLLFRPQGIFGEPPLERP